MPKKPNSIITELSKSLEDDDFGESAPVASKSGKTSIKELDLAFFQKIAEKIRPNVDRTIGASRTRKEALGIQIDNLNECLCIAAELYKEAPMPDNALQVASLTNAYKSSLVQYDKMDDPMLTAKQLDDLIRNIFTQFVRNMVTEVDRVKKGMKENYPETESFVEERFSLMVDNIKPETQGLFEDLQTQIRRILGIRSLR